MKTRNCNCRFNSYNCLSVLNTQSGSTNQQLSNAFLITSYPLNERWKSTWWKPQFQQQEKLSMKEKCATWRITILIYKLQLFRACSLLLYKNNVFKLSRKDSRHLAVGIATERQLYAFNLWSTYRNLEFFANKNMFIWRFLRMLNCLISSSNLCDWNISRTFVVSRYNCDCDDGWTGPTCAVEVEHICASKPCMHGGTCSSDSTGFK